MDFAPGSLLVFGLAFLFVYNDILVRPRQRLWLVVIGSIAFYSCLSIRFVPVLLGSAFADFFIAREIARSRQRNRTLHLLLFSVLINLGVLFYFKYRYFLLSGVPDIFRIFHLSPGPGTGWIVPVGISFYVL